jgi:hypothetical protein
MGDGRATMTRRQPPSRVPPSPKGGVPAVVYEALRGPGAPLDAGTRSLMHRRFGHDFAHVRVHTDERAVESALAVGALAYTVGRSIVFDRGRYAPHEDKGRRLLAHELVHTIQQSGRDPLPAGQELSLGSPASAGEHEARTAAAAPAPQPSPRSPGLLLRSGLGSGSGLRSTAPSGRPVIQRAIPTSGGDWDTDHYDAVRDVDASGNLFPAAQGVRGADITLRFTPNNSVNATLIGLTQSVQSYVAGGLALTPAAATRAIPAAQAKAINTGPGETDEGTAIDRASGFNNPIYPVQSTASASLNDRNTDAGWGQLGWHFTPTPFMASSPIRRDATLIDTPRRAGAAKDSRQVFEVTALATDGQQSGTYYGSVRWGWRTDAAGALTKIELQKVSEGVPSSTFLKAAGIWDKGHSSTGAANIKLSAPEVMITKIPVVLSQAPILPPIVLPVGTRVQVVGGFFPPAFPDTGTLKVVDGPHTGIVGDVHGAGLSWMAMMKPERP